jgi:hypothetical protein
MILESLESRTLMDTGTAAHQTATTEDPSSTDNTTTYHFNFHDLTALDFILIPVIDTAALIGITAGWSSILLGVAAGNESRFCIPCLGMSICSLASLSVPVLGLATIYNPSLDITSPTAQNIAWTTSILAIAISCCAPLIFAALCSPAKHPWLSY